MVLILIEQTAEQFLSAWADGPFLLWGAGIEGARALRFLRSHVGIRGIIDRDAQKHGGTLDGVPIVSYEDARKQSPAKIIVSNSLYPEVAALLREDGLVEDRDFCYWKDYIATLFWRREGKVFLHQVDLSVTQKCVLNCRGCNMFMSLFQQPIHHDLAGMLRDIDLYFRYVDHVLAFNVLGGEPLLYPQLTELLRYLSERYGNRIFEIQLYTNGAMTPSAELLSLCRNARILFNISDYTPQLPQLKPKLEKLLTALRESGIPFRLKSAAHWLDFGYPEVRRESPSAMAEICRRCRPPFRGLYDSKLYYCHIQASAEQLGEFRGQADDWFDLSVYDPDKKLELLRFDLGLLPKGYVSFCGRCDGCGDNNLRKIPVAEQIPRIRQASDSQ